MTATFLIPFFLLIAVMFICSKALGVLARIGYLLLWLVAFVVAGVKEFTPAVFAAFQCVLAAAMFIHTRIAAKKKAVVGDSR